MGLFSKKNPQVKYVPMTDHAIATIDMLLTDFCQVTGDLVRFVKRTPDVFNRVVALSGKMIPSILTTDYKATIEIVRQNPDFGQFCHIVEEMIKSIEGTPF